MFDRNILHSLDTRLDPDVLDRKLYFFRESCDIGSVGSERSGGRFIQVSLRKNKTFLLSTGAGDHIKSASKYFHPSDIDGAALHCFTGC